jgi:hypothetical protein
MVMSATHATYIGNKTKINKRMVMPATHATYTALLFIHVSKVKQERVS